jgi:hypothetical protein
LPRSIARLKVPSDAAPPSHGPPGGAGRLAQFTCG